MCVCVCLIFYILQREYHKNIPVKVIQTLQIAHGTHVIFAKPILFLFSSGETGYAGVWLDIVISCLLRAAHRRLLLKWCLHVRGVLREGCEWSTTAVCVFKRRQHCQIQISKTLVLNHLLYLSPSIIYSISISVSFILSLSQYNLLYLYLSIVYSISVSVSFILSIYILVSFSLSLSPYHLFYFYLSIIYSISISVSFIQTLSQYHLLYLYFSIIYSISISVSFILSLSQYHLFYLYLSIIYSISISASLFYSISISVSFNISLS